MLVINVSENDIGEQVPDVLDGLLVLEYSHVVLTLNLNAILIERIMAFHRCQERVASQIDLVVGRVPGDLDHLIQV
jgi:hypothetical protein